MSDGSLGIDIVHVYDKLLTIFEKNPGQELPSVASDAQPSVVGVVVVVSSAGFSIVAQPSASAKVRTDISDIYVVSLQYGHTC